MTSPTLYCISNSRAQSCLHAGLMLRVAACLSDRGLGADRELLSLSPSNWASCGAHLLISRPEQAPNRVFHHFFGGTNLFMALWNILSAF